MKDAEPGFFQDLAEGTFLGAFAVFDMASDTDPFSLVGVLMLFDAVQHEVFSILLQITEGGCDHASVPAVLPEIDAAVFSELYPLCLEQSDLAVLPAEGKGGGRLSVTI